MSMRVLRYEELTKTWNPVVGCLHDCAYCWARRLAEGKLSNTPRYRDGFTPKLIESELGKTFRNQFVFVSDMGDLFGEWVPKEWIVKVMNAVHNSPSSDFLFLTKNPKRFSGFIDILPDNIVLGATIETNRSYRYTKAPSNAERCRAMAELQFDKKLVSVEPIMDFDLDVFLDWLKSIRTIWVQVGYDNYGCRLPEPSLAKTEQLMKELSAFVPRLRKLSMREKHQASPLLAEYTSEASAVNLKIQPKQRERSPLEDFV